MSYITATRVDNTPTDILVVNAARVSMGKSSEFDPSGGLKEKDAKLLKYLAENGHWTPYAHPRITLESWGTDPILTDTGDIPANMQAGLVKNQNFTKVRHSFYGWVSLIKGGFLCKKHLGSVMWNLCDLMPVSSSSYLIADWLPFDRSVSVVPYEDETDDDFLDYTLREKVPIFVARQRFKHTVGFVYNEVSRRYVDDTPEFYTPPYWRQRPASDIKQGSGPQVDPQTSVDINDEYEYIMHECFEAYQRMLDSGVAPEQARMILPQSMMTEYYVTGSLIAWENAYALRSDHHAQQEIQDLAKLWAEEIPTLITIGNKND